MVTKVKDVGASRVIAVSSSGFSKGAQSKAEHYGVELRTIDEISYENLENWVIPSSLITIVGHHLIAGMTLLSDNPIFKNAKIPFDPNTRCFEHENVNLFSPNDLFNRIPNLSSHYPPDNEHTHKKETFTINLRDTKLFFRLDSNLVKVDGLVLEVELWNQIEQNPLGEI